MRRVDAVTVEADHPMPSKTRATTFPGLRVAKTDPVTADYEDRPAAEDDRDFAAVIGRTPITGANVYIPAMWAPIDSSDHGVTDDPPWCHFKESAP